MIVGVPGLQLVVTPLHLPQLPWLAVVGVLVGLVPAVAAPAPVALSTPRGSSAPTVVPAKAVVAEGSPA